MFPRAGVRALAQVRDNALGATASLVLRRLLLLGVSFVLSGCGGARGVSSGGCLPKHLSVAAARSDQPRRLVRVEGHFLRKNGITRLCEAVLGSASPRCVGPSLVVRRYEPSARVKVSHSSGTAWTSGTVKVYGLVSGRTLRMADCA